MYTKWFDDDDEKIKFFRNQFIINIRLDLGTRKVVEITDIIKGIDE